MKAKHYFFIINILGITYTVLYLIGFLKTNSHYYSGGAIGMFIWIRSMIVGDRKKIFSFYSTIILFMLIFLFFKISWYKTVFWVTFVFAAGQIIPSLIILFGLKQIFDKEDINEKIKLFSVEMLQVVAILTMPFLLRNMFNV